MLLLPVLLLPLLSRRVQGEGREGKREFSLLPRHRVHEPPSWYATVSTVTSMATMAAVSWGWPFRTPMRCARWESQPAINTARRARPTDFPSFLDDAFVLILRVRVRAGQRRRADTSRTHRRTISAICLPSPLPGPFASIHFFALV